MSVVKSAATSTPVTSIPANTTAAVAPRRRGRPASPASPAKGDPRATASLEARRRAAAILEVLAGSRRPSEAAAALGVTVPRYYFLEEQALRGLLLACEPRTLAGPRPETRVAQLEKQLRERERECVRQQALVRAAQRTVGLAAAAAKPASHAGKPPANPAKPGKSRRQRKPTVRALKAARLLEANSSGPLAGEALQPAATGLAAGGESLAAQGKEA